jgi:site-specific DNA-cytosine methylase
MKTTASMFTGGALFDIGATWAGYTPIWGVEKFDNIASVARLNGFSVITADVTEVDYSTLERPDHLHASPPCPSFSVANNNKGETPLDIEIAKSVQRALLALKPDTFTLENVMGYRSSQSFKIIAGTLTELGYWWDADNLNAADFGVPQTRVRLIVRASRGLLRGYPPPVKWRGWYEAIEDLIPTLPDAEFAPWQMARLPEGYKDMFITRPAKFGPEERGKGYYVTDQPAPAVMPYNTVQRAFIVGGANTSQEQAAPGVGVSFASEPTRVLAGNSLSWKAFILDGQSNKNGETVTIRQGENPIFTLSASGERRPARAFVGRVVKMTVQALGRFQTVPDTYQGLTVKINGNGFPCLLAQKVLETL